MIADVLYAMHDAAAPFSIIAAIVPTCSSMSVLRMDRKGFQDASALEDIVNALKGNRNMLTTPFSVQDGKAAAKGRKAQNHQHTRAAPDGGDEGDQLQPR